MSWRDVYRVLMDNSPGGWGFEKLARDVEVGDPSEDSAQSW